MKSIFYRIRQRNLPLFYNGYTLKPVTTEPPYHIMVEDKLKWHRESFWACQRLTTAKSHIYLIKGLSGLQNSDLVLEKCTLGKVEEVKIEE